MLCMLTFSIRTCTMCEKMISQNVFFLNICCYPVALCPYSKPRFHSLTQVLCETQLLKGRKLLFLDLTFPIPVPMKGRKAQVKTMEEYTSQSRVSIPRTVHRCPWLNKRSWEGRKEDRSDLEKEH